MLSEVFPKHPELFLPPVELVGPGMQLEGQTFEEFCPLSSKSWQLST